MAVSSTDSNGTASVGQPGFLDGNQIGKDNGDRNQGIQPYQDGQGKQEAEQYGIPRPRAGVHPDGVRHACIDEQGQ